MKIGIMGGTFDPIHNGHLMLGHAAYEAFSLDQIWFMPNGNPPHKKSETIKSTAEDRMKMTSLAIAPFPEFVLQPYEALRAEVSCSYQTMEHFSKIYPDDEFYFIIGADSLMAIETWIHPERIFPTCTILATYRNEVKTKEEMNSICLKNIMQRYVCWRRLLCLSHLMNCVPVFSPGIPSRNICRLLYAVI